jgi:hypothetical protein
MEARAGSGLVDDHVPVALEGEVEAKNHISGIGTNEGRLPRVRTEHLARAARAHRCRLIRGHGGRTR